MSGPCSTPGESVALGPPQVRRQQLAAEAVGGVLALVADSRLLDRDRTDADLDLALGAEAGSRDQAAAGGVAEVGVGVEGGLDLDLQGDGE